MCFSFASTILIKLIPTIGDLDMGQTKTFMHNSFLPKINLSKSRTRSARLNQPVKTQRAILMSAVFYFAALLIMGVVVLKSFV